jgi:molybdopterin molybdotransferase
VRAGDVVLRAGRLLQPSDLGVLASLGFAEAPVRRRVRVAFFSTGDELKSVGTPLGKGDVYDSNRYTLWGMLTQLGVELLDLGVVLDNRDAVRRAFSEAAQIADAVITSGGVSVGEADYVKGVLEELGEVSFWKIAVKPGRPFAFGRLGEAVFFGLPGNPVSVMVTFEQLVAPALRRMMGQSNRPPMRMRVRCASRLKKAPGRLEFQRGNLATDSEGEIVVRSTGRQGSHVLTSMSGANCYIVLPVESTGAAPGDMVDVEPFGS